MFETYVLSVADTFKDEPWFPPLLAACVIMIALAFMARMGIEIINNLGRMRTIIVDAIPVQRTFKELAMAEADANKELDSLAIDYGADRACLGVFQNGEKSIGNICLLGLTVKAEGSSGLFPRIGSRIKKIPLSTYGDWPMKLITGHNIEVEHVHTVAGTVPEAYLMLEQNSVKSLYVVPVVTPNGDTDGCVFLEYCMKPRKLGEHDLGIIKSRAQAIYSKLHRVNND